RLPDDPVEGGVLRGEPEEGAEAGSFGLDAVVDPRRGLTHRLADPVREVPDHLVEDLALALEVRVEGAQGDPGLLGDLDDRGLVVADGGEDVLGRLEQPGPGARATGGARRAVHGLGGLWLTDRSLGGRCVGGGYGSGGAHGIPPSRCSATEGRSVSSSATLSASWRASLPSAL